ncbi:membrane protein BRI3-like [Pongo abelii]|uniref:membrane protein BRI3-like n=1 Tax=Pongo abelii TaxID=9601 RepID=UPI0023E29E02|nr:brain protein I3-like [Pongo pygmaeus]
MGPAPRLPQRGPSHPVRRVPAGADRAEPSRAGAAGAAGPPWTTRLLQERPPAYNLEAGQGDYACGPHGHGAIPAAPPQPPYSYLVTGTPTHHPRVYNIHSRTVTRYPTNSIVVVGGCPVCRVGVLQDCFTFLGIFLAIILFPFGFICCFALRKRRCPNCGATFA